MVAQTVPDALVIPQAAVLTSASGATSVIVVDADNKPHKETRDARRSATPASVQVTDGLRAASASSRPARSSSAKLDDDVLAKTKVQIQPPKEEEETIGQQHP